MVSSTRSGSSVTTVSGPYLPYREVGRHRPSVSRAVEAAKGTVPAYAPYEACDRLDHLSAQIGTIRDRAVFKLMRNHGLSADQVTKLTLGSVNLEKKKLLLKQGCDVNHYDFQISEDTADALGAYLRVRSPSEERRLFLVEQGAERGSALDVMDIMRDRWRLF